MASFSDQERVRVIAICKYIDKGSRGYHEEVTVLEGFILAKGEGIKKLLVEVDDMALAMALNKEKEPP